MLFFSFSMLFVECQYKILQTRQQKLLNTRECKVKWVLCQGKNPFSNILTWKKSLRFKPRWSLLEYYKKTPKKSEIAVNSGIIIITLLIFNRLVFPVIAFLYLLCPVRCSWQQLCSHAFRCVSRPGRRLGSSCWAPPGIHQLLLHSWKPPGSCGSQTRPLGILENQHRRTNVPFRWIRGTVFPLESKTYI